MQGGGEGLHVFAHDATRPLPSGEALGLGLWLATNPNPHPNRSPNPNPNPDPDPGVVVDLVVSNPPWGKNFGQVHK